MKGQVIQLSPRELALRQGVRQRIEGVIAVFEQIESEELLAALPECPLARRNHLAALDLLACVETELRDLLADGSD